MARADLRNASPLLRALTDLLAGARHAHELAEVLVTEAVQLTLSKIAADFPLDYSMLVKRYQGDVVDACCAMFGDGTTVATCGAPTRTGKPCSRRAVVDGACGMHLGTRREQQAAHRRQEVYAASVRAGPVDPHAAELHALSKKRTVSMAFPNDVAHAL